MIGIEPLCRLVALCCIVLQICDTNVIPFSKSCDTTFLSHNSQHETTDNKSGL